MSTNLLMRITSFHASGTTTAFDGGRTEIWSTPGQGLRLQTTTSQAGKSVDIFCKGGTTYTSAPMLAESLKQSGAADITVPPALADVYVTSKTGQGCDSFYKIPEGAKLAPDHDSSVNGTKTFALTAGNGITSGVYHVAAEGKSYLLKLDSSRGGRSSTTTYDSFGEKFAIKFPAADKTMPMSEFRSRVSGH
ncbi:hypothetical protein [Streptomyces sp. NPDC001678]|uniref:hypothetical protein n=1 Tax=Streptomyces sp. NPDC001678 TaxID=3364599 RepID=UPI0036899022